MITVVYEKAIVTNFEINTENIIINYISCLCFVLLIRCIFLLLKVKRRSSNNEPYWPSHPIYANKNLAN